MEFPEIKQKLSQLDVASLCDAAKQRNLTENSFQVLDAGLRPVQTGLKLIGRAFTVRCYEDFLTVLHALAEAQPDDVLVIDTQKSRRAVLGELFSTEAARRGLAGIVVDGACRDSAGIRKLAFPVYARFTNPMAGTTSRFFGVQEPVNCGGAVVRPGQIVFGDDDGLVVAETAVFAQLIPLAQAVQATEDKLMAQMAAGVSLVDLTNAADHLAKVRAGDVSQLKFVV